MGAGSIQKNYKFEISFLQTNNLEFFSTQAPML